MKSIKILIMVFVLGLFVALTGCSSDSGEAKKPLDNPLVKLDKYAERAEGLVFTSKDDKDPTTADILDIDFTFNFFNIPDSVDVPVELTPPSSDLPIRPVFD